MYLSAPFTVQNFKKIFGKDPESKGHTIFGPKIAQLPQMNFPEKPLI